MGKTLYMFEGGLRSVNDKIFRSVFGIDLSSIESKNVKLYRSSLLKVGEMAYPKLFPVSIPTPDGEKIVVFSTEFSTSCVFELYTPSLGAFEQLPSLNISRDARIITYGFIRNCVLLVKLCGGESFVLDFNSLVKGWVQSSPPPDTTLGHLVVLENGRFYFNDLGVHDAELDYTCDIKMPSSFVESPDPSGVLSREPHFHCCVALVSNDNGQVTVAFLQLRSYFGPLYCDLIIDVCCADLNEPKPWCFGHKQWDDDSQWDSQTEWKVEQRTVKTLKISFVQEDMFVDQFIAFFSIS